jgi:predicted amidophosphoribosyltransferase
LDWRDQDYLARNIVKSIKNEQFNGSFTLKVGGAPRRFDFDNRSDFLRALWPYVTKHILERIEGNASLVPIPNSGATIEAGDYNTLHYAREIARHSRGRLTAVDALRWQLAQDPQHKSAGRRAPEARYANMRLVTRPEPPVILFDDFITSGSSLIAAYWHLDEAGLAPVRAFVVGRRTDEQHDQMVGWFSEDLEIPERFDLFRDFA